MDLTSRSLISATAFQFACSANNFNIVEMMIRNSNFYNFDYTAKDHHMQTGFHRACENGAKEVVEIIIRNSKSFDFDLTAPDCNVETGFQLAKKCGYSGIINIIKNQLPDIAIDYPLIGIENDPITYVHFRMEIKTVFSAVVEGNQEKKRKEVDAWEDEKKYLLKT